MRAQKKAKETLLLNDKDIFPSADVLKSALGKTYPVFDQFLNAVQTDAYGLTPQWNYYNDGKAWLCKLVYKKKTVTWLSVWDGFFRVSFYFTEKNDTEISRLAIDRQLKEAYASAERAGKLKPMAMRVVHKKQLHDLYVLIDYKKSIK